jgi:acyl-CoA synthetase (AMP-forming)/AMP-acid ligase II
MLRVACKPELVPRASELSARHRTEWVMLTSGTTGMPKMVVHSLSSLTAAIATSGTAPDRTVVWSTFYDIRRYGGLQIFFRGILCGGSLVLSSGQEPVGEFLRRAGARGVTHMSGTPSHWRSALMGPAARAISPRYVRLSGEIADQAIIDQLRAFYPGAGVSHAYASTEAGVGFEVDDGREGFPARLIGRTGGDVEIKVDDGSLHIRSPRTAARYLTGDGPALKDTDGFIDTGDIAERRGDRYYFVGRRGGIINVGGLKVHPEEVEAVINRHPDVRACLVRSRRNPITGAIVVAEVVLRADPARDVSARTSIITGEILQACRDTLAEYKVPATIRVVPALEVAATGKLARRHA